MVKGSGAHHQALEAVKVIDIGIFRLFRQTQAWQSCEKQGQGQPQFQPCQRGADTEVQARAKGHVRLDRAVWIEAVRLGPAAETDARAVREGLGLTQEEFAWRFGLDVAALRNWEQGRTRPEAAVRAFLQVIARDPGAVEDALAAS